MTENPFFAFRRALIDKDSALYWRLCNLSPSKFWRQWKVAYPEDFPQDGNSPAHPSSIKGAYEYHSHNG